MGGSHFKGGEGVAAVKDPRKALGSEKKCIFERINRVPKEAVQSGRGSKLKEVCEPRISTCGKWKKRKGKRGKLALLEKLGQTGDDTDKEKGGNKPTLIEQGEKH